MDTSVIDGANAERDQHHARLVALLDIAREVAGRPGDQAVLQRIAEVARDMLPADLSEIAIREANAGHVQVVARAAPPNDRPVGLAASRFHIRSFPFGKRVYHDGEKVIAGSSAPYPESFDSPEVSLPGSKAFFITPLKRSGEVIGSFSVRHGSAVHDWTEDEISWLTALGDQAALSISLGRTLQSGQRDAAVREALHTASQRLQSATDLDTVIQATMEGVLQVVPCVGVAVHLLNEQATEATLAGLRGFERGPKDMSQLVGFKYPADDSVLNRRTLLEHEAFYLRDFQVEADRWRNSDAPTLRAWMSVPLMSQGKCLGKITVDHNLPDVYGPDEVAIVQTFAAHAASAIERAYLYAETTGRADHLAALYSISQDVAAARDEPTLYRILHRAVMQTFTADVFVICLGGTDQDKLEFPVLIDEGVDYGPLVLQPSAGPAGEVLRTGKGLLLKGRVDWERYTARLIGNTSRASEAAIFAPLIWSGVTLGVISVQTYQDRPYTNEEFRTFQALGATVALALGRLRSEEATAQRAAQFAALAQSARALVSNLQLSDLLQTVADRANELTGGEAFLMLYNPEENLITVRTFAGKSPWHEEIVPTATLKPGEGVGGKVFAEQRTIVVQDMLADDRPRYRDESPMRSLVALPLTVGENRMGILELAWPEPGAVTEERLALCTAFADHAALAIHNARQHDELKQREAERTALLRQLLTAQEAERKRVSIDLHDGPLQSLGVGLINADTLRKRAEKEQVTPGDIDSLRRDFASVVNEVRDLIGDLRPEVLDAYGLLPALEAHARRIRETTNLQIRIGCDFQERLPAYMEVLIYRLVQESLSNVRKHAQASQASVEVNVDEERRIVIVTVADDGRGFNPRQMPVRTQGFGLGLSSMAERTEGAGGSMTIESAPGGPTIVCFQIPLT